MFSSANTIKNAQVYNLQGAQVKSVLNTNEVDLSTLSIGLYILEVNTTNGRSVHKVVKQ